MRLMISKSKNAQSLYVIKSVYVNGKRTTKIVEKLGTMSSLQKIHNDPIEWAKNYIKDLTTKEVSQSREVIITRAQSKRLPKDIQSSFNGGYLFLQKIYHDLGLHNICREMSSKHKFTFDLDSILSRLIYGRILFPSSKLSTFHLAQNLLEQPNFDIQHVYRALEIIASEIHYIQASLYKNSLTVFKRNDKILYYDCTNYFFETEQSEGLKQYGFSKEHRPNPIVEMGLFMDGDGIPLAFNIHSGNTNEQSTLMPLEKTIMKDFNLSKFVVCTDAGLSSSANRKFNNKGERAFVTTQSIKKLKNYLKQWSLADSGWLLIGGSSNIQYVLSEISSSDELLQKYQAATFYKERWINENGLEQKLIVTFSFKYRNYQRHIRKLQIDRANKLIDTNPSSIQKHKQTDYKRFVTTTAITPDGEIADKNIYSINNAAINTEELYDGFYAVCTNLDEDASEVAKINHRRWEIEECFRIMKTDFKARPVYLKRDDRIKAHFMTCFLSLTLFRCLEKRLNNKYTSNEIINGLKTMNFYSVPGEGYIPTYTRTSFTDDLHEAFGFHTDYQIVSIKSMKKIFKDTKI